MGVSTGQPWKKSFRFHEVWYSRCYRDKSCNSQMLAMLRGVWSHAESMLGDLQTSVCHSTTWDANLAMELWWNVSMTLTQDTLRNSPYGQIFRNLVCLYNVFLNFAQSLWNRNVAKSTAVRANAVLYAKFQIDWATEMDAMYEPDFSRFGLCVRWMGGGQVITE